MGKDVQIREYADGNSAVNVHSRRLGKSEYMNRAKEAYLDAGKTVLVCNVHGSSLHKRVKGLTVIESIEKKKGYVSLLDTSLWM